MALDLSDQQTVASDAAFQQRCMQALVIYAQTVLAESDTITYHASRAAYASEVIDHQDQINPKTVAELVLTNGTISGEATLASLPGCNSTVPDSDIQYVIDVLFNDLAGIQP